jgi:hypothetical protein
VHAGLSAPFGAGRLAVQAGLGRRDFGADGFYAPRSSYEETRTRFVSAGWAGAVGGGFTLHPRITTRTHDDDFTLIRTNPAIYRNVHASRQRGGELVLRRRPVGGAGLALAAGGEWYRDDVDSDNLATTAADDALGVRAEDRRAARMATPVALRAG